MSSRILPILAGVVMAATASSAFAFDVMASSPMAMRTHATHQAAVIEVVPANAVVDVTRCYRGWCEATYAGQTGYIHAPILVSAASSADVGPITTVLTLPFTAVGGVLSASAPIVATTREPAVTRY
jgi:uncharacterized protein YraI